MKLAASNTAWPVNRTMEILPQLHECGVTGIVVSPNKFWPGAPIGVTAKMATNVRKVFEFNGFAIPAIRSLTFGLKDAAITGNTAARNKLLDCLERQAEIAGHLGATSMIFDSSKLRTGVKRRDALDLFEKVASKAASCGTRICITPLSSSSNEFIKTVAEGKSFVAEVAERRQAGVDSGIGLHLDAAEVAGQKRTPGTPRQAHEWVNIDSFSASAPGLVPPSTDETVDHGLMAEALRVARYDGFVSVEMRQVQGVDPIPPYLDQLDYIHKQYGIEEPNYHALGIY